jgi:hypothetical protein
MFRPLYQVLDHSVMPSRQYSQRQTPVIDSSSSQVHTTRSFLKADEVCVGCVVWLPDKIETSHVGLFGQSDEVLNAEGYYHPAVILGIRPRPASKHISDLEICIALV